MKAILWLRDLITGSHPVMRAGSREVYLYFKALEGRKDA